mgnify:CR=1 FL=1
MLYDAFQKEAISHINEGHSVIVCAPTGAGKTAIAEYVIEECLKRGERVVYTSPIKALSNQKFRDFSEKYPNQVGILTGDVTINAEAPALIMTTEIFRNKIVEKESSLKSYTWIIFDEIHYLDDIERGSVWEESLIFLPDHMRVLGLSATIPNIHELADWLTGIHRRKIKIVQETKRPVPLHFYYQCQGQIYENLNDVHKFGYRAGTTHPSPAQRIPKFISVKPNRPTSLLKFLWEKKLLPCIYFTFSRKHTEYVAEELLSFDFLNPEEKEKIQSLYHDLCQKFDILHEPSTYALKPLIERGIAYHHAGMLPTLKEVIERLFTTRLIKVICTTETFALGVNMPARTVVFNELRKFYERSYRILKTRDFYQMAGRAGRRSIDDEGFVFCRVNPHEISVEELKTIIFSRPEKIASRFNASYATILNLYETFGEKLYDVYPLSFHHFQEGKQARADAVRLLRAKVNLLKQLGHIRKNRITAKGLFAAKVYGYELILSELFARGILEKLSTLQLGLLALAIVYEPRKGMRRPSLTRMAKELEHLTHDLMFPILKMENTMDVRPLSKLCSFHLSAALEGWMRDESFDRILKKCEADEGEVVRCFRMAIQVLREILDAPLAGILRDNIRKAIAKINRDLIDAEKQLRI